MVSLREIYQICDTYGYKYDNATRRLRHSESPDVEPVKNPSGAIIGYRWKESEVVRQFMAEWGPKPIKKPEGVLF